MTTQQTSGAPRCPLCGAGMREELDKERHNAGLVQRWWTCPSCLHRETTIEDVCGDGEEPSPSDEKREDRWQTS